LLLLACEEGAADPLDEVVYDPFKLEPSLSLSFLNSFLLFVIFLSKSFTKGFELSREILSFGLLVHDGLVKLLNDHILRAHFLLKNGGSLLVSLHVLRKRLEDVLLAG